MAQWRGMIFALNPMNPDVGKDAGKIISGTESSFPRVLGMSKSVTWLGPVAKRNGTIFAGESG